VILQSQVAEVVLLSLPHQEDTDMAKGEQRGNRETKKPKKEKPKSIAAAPSLKGSTGSNAGSKK
jgi:hypothetical protein